MENIKSADLRELGFTEVANDLDRKLEFKRKMTIAYEHFRVVTPGIMDRFKSELKKKTLKTWKNEWGNCQSYEDVVLIPVNRYGQIPPAPVLESMKKAKDMNCFDSFVVAKTEVISQEAQEPRPDPIIFGQINGCDDLFFIDQWDNDIKIEDVLRDNEG